MALCFEVTINDEQPVLAGLADAKVLTAILTFAAAHQDLSLQVAAMASNSEHVDWISRDVQPGDVITIRIVESDSPAPPMTRHAEDLP